MRWLAVASAVMAVVALAAYWFLHPSPIDGLRVERASIVAPGDRSGAPRIAVDFSVPKDLAATRARLDVGYIAARLSACDTPGREQREVVTQHADYLGDHGRVTKLPAAGGRSRYRALFDDRLTQQVDHRPRDTPARGQALCFDLRGGNMGWGTAASATIPLGPLD